MTLRNAFSFLPLNGSIADFRPGLGLDSDTPTDGDMGIGDISEDGNLALGIDRSTDGTVVWESDVDSVLYSHGEGRERKKEEVMRLWRMMGWALILILEKKRR